MDLKHNILKRIYSFLLIGLTLLNLSPTYAQVSYEVYQDHDETDHNHAHTLNPEEEKRYYEEARQKGNFDLLNFKFPQTDWRECTDTITGNYTNYNCANRRAISVILKDFMDNYMPLCVQKGMDAAGLGELDQLHIIHDGILGDRRHSPRSMHAENRAIDIRAFRVTTYDSRELTLNFKDSANRTFYREFRKCWGEVIQTQNNCPLYGGNVERTGSIGWEDKNHQNHMHTSVPYCVNGSYGSYYYRR